MREFLVRKIDRCIECSSCILACKRRHKVSRMTLEDKKFDCVSLPKTCKSCSDPECVKACRKEAMVKENDKVFVDWDKCVGCGLCSKACPYDSIIIIDLSELENKGLFKRKKKDTKKKRRSNKCDLCKDFESSACVEACPNNALQRWAIDAYNDENLKEVLEFLNNPPEKPKKK